MTFKLSPKEEAKELVDRFSEYSHTDFDYNKGGYQVKSQIANAKQSALIAIQSILKVAFYASDEIYEHYLQVKNEIEKL